jgi:hypothetical protein
MSEEAPVRTIVFEIPSEAALAAEEIEQLAAEFRSRLIDTKSEKLVVRAKPKEKTQVSPQIVDIKEVAVPKEQAQSA